MTSKVMSVSEAVRQIAEWTPGLPPGKYYPGMEDDYEVRFTPMGQIFHRKKVK